MKNYLVVRAEEERRRKRRKIFGGRTHRQTDNLKSVLEFWIQNLLYMIENNQFLTLFTVQSVLAPGFFTMASNVVTSSFKDIHPEMARSPN